MNIIIAGDGEVGVHLAKSLSELDHNITVVDPHSELLKRLESESDLLTITGDSTSPQVLIDANVADCDLFLSVLHEESINLVTCILAKKLKAKKTVARITNAELLTPKHREMFRDLGVDELVCPERIAAKEITNLLNNSVATEFFDFSGGLLAMYVIRLDADSPVIGHDVKELTQTYPELQVRVVALLRNGDTLIPHSDTVFRSGDLAYIIGRANQLDGINRAVGKHSVSIRNTMIAGGGRIGRYAAMTLQDKMRITLIEEDRQRAEELSALLDDTLIIHGDATDIELLKEEGLLNADAFIGVTDSSETNVLTCLHAKRLGVKRTIASSRTPDSSTSRRTSASTPSSTRNSSPPATSPASSSRATLSAPSGSPAPTPKSSSSWWANGPPPRASPSANSTSPKAPPSAASSAVARPSSPTASCSSSRATRWCSSPSRKQWRQWQNSSTRQ